MVIFNDAIKKNSELGFLCFSLKKNLFLFEQLKNCGIVQLECGFICHAHASLTFFPTDHH